MNTVNDVNVYFYTLGCKVNQAETNSIKKYLKEKGLSISSNDEGSDYYIVNSCTVTSISDRKTRNFARRGKKLNKNSKVIVIGCCANINEKSLKSIAEIDFVITSKEKDKVKEKILKIIKNDLRTNSKGDKSETKNSIDDLTKAKSVHKLTTQLTRDVVGGLTKDVEANDKKNKSIKTKREKAFLKIQDGCNMFCSYCIIPYARPVLISKSKKEILKNLDLLYREGYKEIVLTGINIALYYDEKEKIGLVDLLKSIDKMKGDFKITLGSLESNILNLSFFKKIIGLEKLSPKFHISLQSGSDKVLKSMNRNYKSSDVKKVIDFIRTKNKNAFISSDIIVGFPGESEEDFKKTYNFLKANKFDHLHIFRYSKRPQTKAPLFEHQVDEEVKKQRANKLKELN